jgi:hypothetical protein
MIRLTDAPADIARAQEGACLETRGAEHKAPYDICTQSRVLLPVAPGTPSPRSAPGRSGSGALEPRWPARRRGSWPFAPGGRHHASGSRVSGGLARRSRYGAHSIPRALFEVRVAVDRR